MVKTDLGDLKTRTRTGAIYDQKSIFRLNLLIVFSVCCFGACCLFNIDDSEHLVSLLPTYGVMNFLCTAIVILRIYLLFMIISMLPECIATYQVKKSGKR